MSASSNCVTCGMLTQLACRRGPEMRWMRDERLDLDGAELRRSRRHGTVGQRAAARRRLASRCGAAARHAALDERLDVIVRDAALEAGAADARQVDAQLARKLAHRGSGVRAGEASLVDRRQIGAQAAGMPQRRAVPSAAGGGRRLGAAVGARGWRRGGTGCSGGRGRGRGCRRAAAAARLGRRGRRRRRAAPCAPRRRRPAASRSESPAWTLRAFAATCTFSMTPLAVEGTSMVAFSVSSVTSGAVDLRRSRPASPARR